MKRTLCIWLPDWTVQRFNLERPELKDRPVVFFEVNRGSRRVVACSARARHLGVVPGMPLSEATALADAAAESTALHLEPYDPTADRRALEKIAQWCQKFSPLVGLEDTEPPSSLLLDITGLEHFFGGESALADKIVRSFRCRGLNVRVSIADTLGAAWALSHFGKTEGETRTSSSPLLPLPIEALRLPRKTVEQLHQLGVYQVGQLALLPRRELNSRFGPELLRRWDQTMGRLAEPVLAQPIPVDFHVEESLDYPTTRRETVAVIFQRLIGQLAEMLLRNGRGATRLLCRLDCEGIEAETFSVGMFQPTASPQHLFQLVEMQLEQLLLGQGVLPVSQKRFSGGQGVLPVSQKRFSGGQGVLPVSQNGFSLPAPVTAVSVRAAITAPLEHRQQELFVGDREARRPRYLAALIDRLSSRLGHRAVVRPRLAAEAQPELAYHCDPLVEDRKGEGEKGRRRNSDFKVSPSTSLPFSLSSPRRRRFSLVAPAKLPPRPLRLVRRPVSLVAVSVQPDGPPLSFQFHGRSHRVAATAGPERIQTGWWRGRIIGRDYYRIETTTGCRFWLFRRLRDGQWFLHGIFE